MRRRDAIAMLGGTAIVWPHLASAQDSAMPVIGFLRNTSSEDSAYLVAAFRQGLKESGYIEGQNLTIEFRWAEGHLERLANLAADLVNRRVAVIAAGGNAAIRSAKAATATVPIVFATGEDPVKLGFVNRINRPDGNLTGASFATASQAAAKQVGILHELAPKVTTFALIVNPNGSNVESLTMEMQNAARLLGLKTLVLSAISESDLEPAFAAMTQQQVGALIINGDALLFSHRDEIASLAARHAIPAIYPWHEAATAGGLMSYGTSIIDAYRQAGIYAGKILAGAKPAELPVLLPTRYELVINLKTAKALGLTIPPPLLATADEVIE
ncbi:MAG TPA: ABC transporter substrate-binding protein [Stellaceae bacterium]|nr:ABC transporter substrate-binding protein [Stellaceae bacterium]